LLPFRSRKYRESVRTDSSWSPRPKVVQDHGVRAVCDNRAAAGQSPSEK